MLKLLKSTHVCLSYSETK